MQFSYNTDQFTAEVLEAQDGKEMPLTLEPGGPVIGRAVMKYDPETQTLNADLTVESPELREILEAPASDHFGLPVIFDRRKKESES